MDTPWVCESLVNSVVMKPPMRTPRGQSSLCDHPPALGFCSQWEPSLINSAGRAQAAGGDCGLQDIPWRLSGALPSGSDTLLHPTAQGILVSTSSRELPADWGDTPSLRLRLYRCFVSGLFLLTQCKSRRRLCPLYHRPQF